MAIDVILADETDPENDARLEASLRAVGRLILSSDIDPIGKRWEDPLPRFQGLTAAEPGHVELPQNPQDGVTRQIPLERVLPGARRWALSLQVLASLRSSPITESPEDVEAGGVTIPARRTADDRA